MLSRLERMGNQIPPRLKAILNVAISLVLLFLSVPLLWEGATETDLSRFSLGAGVLLLAVFNLFT